MTHDEMIAVIAAHRDGKVIECRSLVYPDTGWAVHGNGQRFAFDTIEYRLQCREFWILLPGEGAMSTQIVTTKPANERFIHVREVLP